MIELKPLPFAEAIAFFRGKGLVVSPTSWRDVWADANVLAFTVARVAAMDVLEDIRRAVDRAVKAGVPLREFKRALSETLARKGWVAPPGEPPEEIMPDGTVRKRLTPWRLDTIYRTNVQSAYQTGRYRQMIENAPNRPWWLYDAVNDARTRPAHAAMDGRVYRFDHPIWDKWYPPNGFNCRCTVRTLSDRDMDRLGLKQSTRPPAAEPDEGFAYNPGLARWQPDLSRYAPKARTVLRHDLEAGPGPLPVESWNDMVRVLTEKLGAMLPHGIQRIEIVDEGHFMATDCTGRFKVSNVDWDLSFMGGPRSWRAKEMLEKGMRNLGRRKLAFDEEYALESFWHECLHNRQVLPTQQAFHVDPQYYQARTVLEAVTQWTARRTYQQMLDALGGYRPAHQDEIIRRGYGYHYVVKNLDSLLERVGVDKVSFKRIAVEVIESVPMDQYVNAIVDRLGRDRLLEQERLPQFRDALMKLDWDPTLFSEAVLGRGDS